MDDIDPLGRGGGRRGRRRLRTAFNNDDEVDDNGVGNDDDDDDATPTACADDPQWQKSGSKTKACAWVAESSRGATRRAPTAATPSRRARRRAACVRRRLLLRIGAQGARGPQGAMLPTGHALLPRRGVARDARVVRHTVQELCRGDGGVGSDTIISVSDDPDDEGFERSSGRRASGAVSKVVIWVAPPSRRRVSAHSRASRARRRSSTPRTISMPPAHATGSRTTSDAKATTSANPT